jgi:hypothetical protein
MACSTTLSCVMVALSEPVVRRHECGVAARRQGCEGDFAIARDESSPSSNGVRLPHSSPVQYYISVGGRLIKVPMLGWKVDVQTSSKHANRGPRSAFIARHIDHRGRALLTLAVQSPGFADQNPF